MFRPPYTPALRLQEVREAVEGIPLDPGAAPLREARALLDAGSLRGVDIERGAPKKTAAFDPPVGGGEKTRYYFEYDAPPYCVVAAVPHEGALYVVHATSPSGRGGARALRDVVDSFRVG